MNTQAPNTTAHPPTKSGVNAIRRKLLLGIVVSLRVGVPLARILHIFTPRDLRFMGFLNSSIAWQCGHRAYGAINKILADALRRCEIHAVRRLHDRSRVTQIARRNCGLLLTVVAVALPTASASAQMSPQMSFPTQKQQKQLTPEQQQYQKQLDESYKAANKKIPDQKPSDPWAAMRSAPSDSARKTKQQ
jgi:hypothetical protein